MKSLAIIGTGLTGLACGHYLHPSYDITLYERSDEAGGQIHSAAVEEGDRQIAIDTGFMAYHAAASPRLAELFAALGVDTQPAGVSWRIHPGSSGVGFSGPGLPGFFAQPGNLWNPRFWKLLREIRRFHRDMPAILGDADWRGMTLRAYVDAKHYSPSFVDAYLIPIGAMFGSMPSFTVLDMPAIRLAKILKTYGFLEKTASSSWRTISQGGQTFRDTIARPFRHRLRLGRPAVRISRRPGAAQVADATGYTQSFDYVVLACRADEALALLEEPTPDEQALLAPFRYQTLRAVLHTDASVMPPARAAWAAWNYGGGTDETGRPKACVTFWMNRLQGIRSARSYFVSLDPEACAADTILQTSHPRQLIYTAAVLEAQRALPRLNEGGTLFFCGGYFSDGFPEGALQSAQAVCQRLKAIRS
jgi:uncharacterized protein